MNTYSEYDVDDDFDLPANTSNATTTAPIKNNVARISRRGKEVKDKDEEAADNKITRKPRPKLDFNRLLKGSRGLGYLAVCAKKNLNLSGKPGSEAYDLSQISVYLQEWAKKVFPKMPLMDFLLKVEDICQSRLMKVRTIITLFGQLINFPFVGLRTSNFGQIEGNGRGCRFNGFRNG